MFPDELPITARLAEIAEAMANSQVVVVTGETGSGKTTQLPKLCLSLGRGCSARIAHTQPRRLAARSVADRIAAELKTEPGDLVGSRVRFSDRTSAATRVVLMTDGLLLAEIRRDPLLRRYDTVIIDEAHERSLTIDFLLGYLAEILPRRPDLAVVVTSATIEPERVADHFERSIGRPVPIVEVSGRTYPVEVRYRPFGPGHDPSDAVRDQPQAVLDAVDELGRLGGGDVLVFLSGEREIRDTAEALTGHLGEAAEVLPLYARLSTAEQRRVFAPAGRRRVVLATNVAETSLTVPGIRYVVDAGTARVSRYNTRTKVQRLPVEPVSQSAADQRKGRCGRVADGVCIRLYAEDDFLSRPRFTDPEILRTNLASVILQMAALGLGDLDRFPFLDAPDSRSLRDGVQTLEELGAFESADSSSAPSALTSIGRALARLPVDPRLGRMILAADERGCVQEVLVIAAALTIQDPREWPADSREAAAQAHARFRDTGSDLIAYLNLWVHIQTQQQELSGSQFRKACRRDYLHYVRVREWQDLVTQLRQACREIGIPVPARPDLRAQGGHRAHPDAIHQAVLTGLLSHVGTWDLATRDYAGTRGSRFVVNRSSALAKKPPSWVMAGELVQTSRVFARDVARIDPSWIEPLAGHLLKRSFSEPRWARSRGSAVATEKATLYGLPVIQGRAVNLGRIDPPLAREIFVRHALVDGDWDSPLPFEQANARVREDVAAEERRTRRSIAVDDETLFDLYQAAIPQTVISARHLTSWWKRASTEERSRLFFSREQLTRQDVDTVSQEAFPSHWTDGDLRLPLTYVFEPGSPLDGATVTVPVDALGRLDIDAIGWHVPGLRRELVVGLIRSLPKALRRSFVPAPDYAHAVLERIDPGSGGIEHEVAKALTGFGGPVVTPADLSRDSLPPHLRLHVRVVDLAGEELRTSDDAVGLARTFAGAAQRAVSQAAHELERRDLRDWPGGAIPRTVNVVRPDATAAASGSVTGYPALVDASGRVDLRVLPSSREQHREMVLGTRRLLLLQVPSPVAAARRGLDTPARLALAATPYADLTDLVTDCAACAVDDLVRGAGGPAWDEGRFLALRDTVLTGLVPATTDVLGTVVRVQGLAHGVASAIDALRGDAVAAARNDLEVQLDGLLFPGYVSATGAAQLSHLPRYLKGMLLRIESLARDRRRDEERMADIHPLEDRYLAVVDDLAPAARGDEEVRRARWLIEEYRVSVFAQQLGTAQPVSLARVRRALDAVQASGGQG